MSNEESIELYCQNPQCGNPLISKTKEYVAEINGALVHSKMECMRLYVGHEIMKSRSIIFAETKYILYSKAEELARKGKVKFSKLEKRASLGGMGQ